LRPAEDDHNGAPLPAARGTHRLCTPVNGVEFPVTVMGVARSIDDLPGPPGLPLLGNAHQVRPSTLHSVAEGWCGRYGPIFRFRLGPRPVVCIGDLAAINAILRDRPNGYRRDRALKHNFDESGISGVFVPRVMNGDASGVSPSQR
jgi:Cytochrome P450